MQSSYKIIKGFDKTFDCRLLELKRIYKEEDLCDDEIEEKNGKTGAEINYEQMAALILHEAGEKAQKIIDESQKKAVEIEEKYRRKAEEEAELIREEAMRDGFEEGRKEALAKAAADASSIRDQARSVLRQAEEIRRRTIQSVESEIVRLAVEMSEKVLSAKLNMDPSVVVEIAKEAMGMLHNRDQVVLYVNPSEVALYEERREDLEKCLSPRGELIIIKDVDIVAGGCIAETENGRVDARLDSRWNILLESLGEIAK